MLKACFTMHDLQKLYAWSMLISCKIVVHYLGGALLKMYGCASRLPLHVAVEWAFLFVV